MLYEAGHLAQLESYIRMANDPQLLRWWARYCESVGSFDQAMATYQQVLLNNLAKPRRSTSCFDNPLLDYFF